MSGWSQQTWGLGTWGLLGTINVSVTGQALTAALGNETVIIDVDQGVVGLPLTAALGNETVSITNTTIPTGILMSTNLGQADAGPDAMATGIAMSMGLGTIDAFNQTGWGRQQWNVNAWGVEGQYASITLTGIAMTAALGNETVSASAILTLNTLNVAQATLGNVDPAPDANFTGLPMIASVGTVLGQAGAGVILTGEAMTAGLGTVTAVPGQEVPLTGLPLTSQLSSVTPIIHVDVGLTGLSLTINQGSGSALIWNEVDTGSAPIIPPGWQEVAA